MIPLPTIEIPWRPELDVRAAMMANALSLVGLRPGDELEHGRIGLAASDPESRDAFRDLLGPPPRGGAWDLSRPFRCWSTGSGYRTQGVSTCGLVAAGLLRRVANLGWDGPYWAWPGFERLDVVSALSRLGQRCQATEREPRAGSVVCIGSGLRTHVLTVVAVEGDVVWSVDGGQVDVAGLQCVKLIRRQRPWRQVWSLDVDAVELVLPRWEWRVVG